MQDSEDYCFQLIEDAVAFPPILLKAEIQGTVPHGTPSSSSQGSSKSFLRLQAIRFLNGKQEIVQRDLGGEDDSDAFVKAVSGKKGLNKHMSNQECCQEVYDRLKATKFKFDYNKRDHAVKVAFDDLKTLDVSFDFKIDVKRFPVTPAFVVAFEAACSFGKLMRKAVEVSNKASEELKEKERELRQAERKANNLTADLSVEKQRFQRLLSSGGSSMEDALAPRGVGKGGRRTASSFMEGSILAHDPDSPRKKRKAADAVLVKAGRTAQKETKKGFIDSSSDEDDTEGASTSKASGKQSKPSSTDTTDSSSVMAASKTARPVTKSPKSTGKQTAKAREVPSLNARRSIRSAKDAVKGEFVESDEEEEEEVDDGGVEAGSGGGKSNSKQHAAKKPAAGDSDTEKTASDSDNETVKKGKKGK